MLSVKRIGMEDKENQNVPMVSRDVLVKQGSSAVFQLAGGLFLLIMTFGARSPILGLILSAAALVIGAAALFSRSREDKKPGLVITAAGVLGLVVRFGIPLLRPFAAFALGLGAVGLFATGIITGIKFLRGLKSRQ
jgi:hypothetical protein